jgi:DNA-binding transcriptional ArsR family regulator
MLNQNANVDSKQAELFKILGVESRIRIIDLLKQKGPLCVNEMSEILGISPSAVSQHLRVLKYAELVHSKRKGYWVPYEVNPAALEQCGEFLSRVCTCGGGGTCHINDAENSKAEDKLTLLRKYERGLQREIREVRTQIEKLEDST